MRFFVTEEKSGYTKDYVKDDDTSIFQLGSATRNQTRANTCPYGTKADAAG